MSYQPTNWKNGDVITADKLNHMEDGIVDGSDGNSVFNVSKIYDEQIGAIVFDKTWQEIYDASKNGALVVVLNDVEETNYMFSGKEIVCTIVYQAHTVPEYILYTTSIDGGRQTTTIYGCDSSADFPHEWRND